MKYLNEKKLEKIKINKENLYVVIDFDKTIMQYYISQHLFEQKYISENNFTNIFLKSEREFSF